MNYRKLTDYPLYTVPAIIWFSYLFIREPSMYRGFGLITIIVISIILCILLRPKNYSKQQFQTEVDSV